MRTRIANYSSVAFVGALWVALLLFGVFAAVSVHEERARSRRRHRRDGDPPWRGRVFSRRRAVAADRRFVQRDAVSARKRRLRERTGAAMPVRRPSRQDCPSSTELRVCRRRGTVMPAAAFVC